MTMSSVKSETAKNRLEKDALKPKWITMNVRSGMPDARWSRTSCVSAPSCSRSLPRPAEGPWPQVESGWGGEGPCAPRCTQ